MKKYSHIEPESLLQEFSTNNAAIRHLLTLTPALILYDNIVCVRALGTQSPAPITCAVISLYISIISETYKILFKVFGMFG